MYYHVIIELNEKVGKKKDENKEIIQKDITSIEEIEEDIVAPYLKKNKFQFQGYFLEPDKIIRLVIRQSEKNSDGIYADYEMKNRNSNVVVFITSDSMVKWDKYTKDITKDIFKKVSERVTNNSVNITSEKPIKFDKSSVFIVHGHDDLLKIETARFIEQLGIKAIILHEQASSSMTIIEKIEEYTNVSFGIILYTPCDVGAKKSESPELNPRARQNVVFEHGYLIGKLGRKNVCALVKAHVETPSDISGVVYISVDTNGAWKYTLAKEMKASGYSIDMNKI
jgi:predicted nucleotide-binding protein